MPIFSRSHMTWRLRTREVALGVTTQVMGILNVTPDSFSDGGRYLSQDHAVRQGLALLDQGAHILDVGGESTRPGAEPTDQRDEQARILPVIRAILDARPEAILSVDTYHAETAEAAMAAGVEIVNDVSGLLWDQRMAEVLARWLPGVVLMHTRGAPYQWQSLGPLRVTEVLPMVNTGLTHSIHLAQQAGVPPECLMLDPGFGFGKSGAENFTLHAELPGLRRLSLPLLAGTSRKRFLAAVLDQPVTEQSREIASHASAVASVLAGAHVVRVHDVAGARAAVAVADAILAGCQFQAR